MGGLGDRLKRTEKAAGEHFTTVSCPSCGEAFRYAGDLALDVVVAEWARVAEGEEAAQHVEHPIVTSVMDHEHVDLLHEVLRDIPGLCDARAR